MIENGFDREPFSSGPEGSHQYLNPPLKAFVLIQNNMTTYHFQAVQRVDFDCLQEKAEKQDHNLHELLLTFQFSWSFLFVCLY